MSGELAYISKKGGIDAFTSTLAVEVMPKGITVNTVNPGPTRFPMGRMGLPDDAARLTAFWAGEEAQWITGQIVHSEGGFIR